MHFVPLRSFVNERSRTSVDALIAACRITVCSSLVVALSYASSPALAADARLPALPPATWWSVLPPYNAGCYPFVSCTEYQQWQTYERRKAREQALGQQPPQSLPAAPLHIAPSNPETVRPEFAESGTVREQYRGSGEVLSNPAAQRQR